MPYVVGWIFIVPILMWRGFVVMKLWGWFIVPFFHAPPLTIAMAIAIMLIGTFVTDRSPSDNSGKLDWERLGKLVVYAAINPAFVLLLGWLLLQAM